MLGPGSKRLVPSATGLTRLQTINCDYLHASMHATIEKAEISDLHVQNINSPVITQLLNEVFLLRQEVALLKAGTSPFESGEQVQFSTHVDINPQDMEPDELESVLLAYRQALAAEAGVTLEDVVILQLVPSGSADITTQVNFKRGPGEDSIAQMEELKNNLVQKLESNQLLQDLEGLGDIVVDASSVDSGAITSMQSRVTDLERKFKRDTVDFSSAKSFTLSHYKFETVQNDLKLMRYDEDTDTYVAGNLILDS